MGLIGMPGTIVNVVVENFMPSLIREGTNKFFMINKHVVSETI